MNTLDILKTNFIKTIDFGKECGWIKSLETQQDQFNTNTCKIRYKAINNNKFINNIYNNQVINNSYNNPLLREVNFKVNISNKIIILKNCLISSISNDGEDNCEITIYINGYIILLRVLKNMNMT